ncbi:protein transport protein HofC [Kalamiella sp. sgz302252]|uniref:protein transport protein HofC n=1 Tax=Pantoea sp. sgz302252 TaxID=3341827 RepID=UPI0036D32B68
MADPLLINWQATDKEGAFHQGFLLCSGQQEAAERLMALDLLPLKLTKKRRYRASDWKWQHKIAFFRELATLLQAGMTLSASLRLAGEGHADPAWQALLMQTEQSVSEGVPFSQALAEWPVVFPPLYPALIAVGELTGRMDECCLRLASQQEREQLLQKKVIKALRYPLFVIAVALLVSIGMLVFVLPEFVSIYQSFNAPLPAFTAAVIALSGALQRYGMVILPLACASFACWRWQSRRQPGWQRSEQRWLLRLPLIGRLYRGGQLSRIFLTLALTQQAGLTLLEGLQAVEKTLAHRLWREAIIALQQHIASGNPLHQALAQHALFTPLCYQLIKVGEEAGALDSLLLRLGEWHEANTHELADNLAAALEPLMMLVTGVLVGTLVVAMYLPIFNLGDALG